jgi:biofilm PGA synthesis lipoprotein PgaB
MGSFDTFMKVFFCFMLAAMLGFLPVSPGRADSKGRFVAIAYHDVVRSRAELASDAVTIDHLVSQFEWLLANQYHPVSVDDLLAARRGKKPLPDRAVLLCWDDGYASFYELVFPLLKAYNFPAVLALEGSWIEPGPATKVRYGQNTMPRSHFLSWRQLRELAASPLVEIASHSYDLHHGVLADRFGDKLPAAIVHRYDPRTRRYETDREQFERIYNDLERNSRLLQKRLGKRPRVMVWPFGRYNQAALAAASRAGMDITLTLDPVPGDINNLREIGRVYPTLNPDLADFRGYLNPDINPPVRHFFKVDSRLLLDDSAETEHHFSLFLNRLKSLRPAMVSFAPIVRGPAGPQALFPNRVLPVAQDRLTRLSWHTAHRGGSGVFLWLESMLFEDTAFEGDRGVQFFADMGKHAFCEGVLVDAPGLLTTLLDSAPVDFGTKPPLYWDPARRKLARQRLLAKNTRAAAPLAKLAALQKWQPFLELGLVLPVEKLAELTPARAGYLLRFFDFLLVDTRRAEGISIRHALRKELGPLQRAGLLGKMYFLFARGKGDAELAELFGELPRENVINWGYAYDDFLGQEPGADTIRPYISNATNPFE